MLIINDNVILRRDKNCCLLFDLNSGTMTKINQTGELIWQCLKQGLSEQQTVNLFKEKCPEIPSETLAEQIHHFLLLLAGKSYLYGFTEKLTTQDSGDELLALPGNRAIYELNSMRRVFTPGDALILTEIPFSKFKTGDIITFYPNGENSTGIVHRIIKRNFNTLTTMGDNNPVPDQKKVTINECPKLVIAKIRPDGKYFKVFRGTCGWLQFIFNRLCYWQNHFIAKIIHPFLPWMFWRKTIDLTVEFDTVIQYYRKGELIAKRTGMQLEYQPKWRQLFYKLPNGE